MRTPIYRESKSFLALPAGARVNGVVNGATVDRWQGSNPSVLFVITSGVVTDGTHTFAVQESDDGTNWTVAAADSLQGAAPVAPWSTASNSVWDVGYFGAQRFVRLTVTGVGATTGGFFSAAAILYGSRKDR